MLETEIAGLKLKNPTILASGIMGSTGSSIKRIAMEGGAGAVVTKSVGMEPREGHKNPTVIEVEEGLLNAVGLSNPGIEEFKVEIETAKEGKVPLIVSVFGFNVEEFGEVAKKAQEFGADAIELNLSCPNVEKAGAVYGSSPELSGNVVDKVKSSVDLPVFAKLTASTGDIVEVASACVDAGCDGITAINTLPAMKIDIHTKSPVLGNKTGGLSGPSIKPVALRCVYEISKELDIPVVGCGGITTGEDALEFLMAGAKAVEIGTAIRLRGIGVFERVCTEIEAFMEENGYKNLEGIIGAAL
jgi:dihydroorotate dehydrogenase (NAD+) catalytic subunit